MLAVSASLGAVYKSQSQSSKSPTLSGSASNAMLHRSASASAQGENAEVAAFRQTDEVLQAGFLNRLLEALLQLRQHAPLYMLIDAARAVAMLPYEADVDVVQVCTPASDKQHRLLSLLPVAV